MPTRRDVTNTRNRKSFWRTWCSSFLSSFLFLFDSPVLRILLLRSKWRDDARAKKLRDSWKWICWQTVEEISTTLWFIVVTLSTRINVLINGSSLILELVNPLVYLEGSNVGLWIIVRRQTGSSTLELKISICWRSTFEWTNFSFVYGAGSN